MMTNQEEVKIAVSKMVDLIYGMYISDTKARKEVKKNIIKGTLF